MKQVQHEPMQKQYTKARLQPFIKIRQTLDIISVTASVTVKKAVNRFKCIIKAIDSYFFDEESADIRPYFYGSLGFSILVTIAVHLMIL